MCVTTDKKLLDKIRLIEEDKILYVNVLWEDRRFSCFDRKNYDWDNLSLSVSVGRKIFSLKLVFPFSFV